MNVNGMIPGGLGGRLLSGWNRLFGNKQETDKDNANTATKPFPANHFFSQEELLFLARNQGQCTNLQKWALQLSLWAKGKSNEHDRGNPQFMPAVQWQDGLMSTWIDQQAVPDEPDQQADRLLQLQLDGHELDAAFLRMIDARACRSLVGCLFGRCANGNQKGEKRYLRVAAVVDKRGEELALAVCLYNKVSHLHDLEETIPYKRFKSQVEDSELIAISNEGQRKWNEEATVRDKAQKTFVGLLAKLRNGKVSQGIFPAHNVVVMRLTDGRDRIPVSWSLVDDEIRISFAPKDGIGTSFHSITSDNCFQFVEVMDHISNAMYGEEPNRDLLFFVRLFGKDFCGEKVLPFGKQHTCKIGGVVIDRVTAKLSDTIVAFNSETLETPPLTPFEQASLLKAVILRCDSLLAEWESLQDKTEYETGKDVLRGKINIIHNALSAYDVENKHVTFEALWDSITSRFGVAGEVGTMGEATAPKAGNAPLPIEDGGEVWQESNNDEPQRLPNAVGGKNVPTVTERHPGIGRAVSDLWEGYIQIGTSPKGRWHTPEMLRREAYRAYGNLLSKKLKRQLDNQDNPWVSKTMLVPRDINGIAYKGANAIMLALWTENHGFELPFFITEDEIRANGMGILQDAECTFILTENGASKAYNIAQTTFPITQRRAYESLKLNMIAAERKKSSGYQFLDSDSFNKTALLFDGVPGLSTYDHAGKVIHIAPKDCYEMEDDFYRDLAVALVESTRDVDFDTLRLDSYLFENLVSHLGSGIISQNCRFDATNPEYSILWRERLESNPEYTRMVLEQSLNASSQVLREALE